MFNAMEDMLPIYNKLEEEMLNIELHIPFDLKILLESAIVKALNTGYEGQIPPDYDAYRRGYDVAWNKAKQATETMFNEGK